VSERVEVEGWPPFCHTQVHMHKKISAEATYTEKDKGRKRGAHPDILSRVSYFTQLQQTIAYDNLMTIREGRGVN